MNISKTKARRELKAAGWTYRAPESADRNHYANMAGGWGRQGEAGRVPLATAYETEFGGTVRDEGSFLRMS